MPRASEAEGSSVAKRFGRFQNPLRAYWALSAYLTREPIYANRPFGSVARQLQRCIENGTYLCRFAEPGARLCAVVVWRELSLEDDAAVQAGRPISTDRFLPPGAGECISVAAISGDTRADVVALSVTARRLFSGGKPVTWQRHRLGTTRLTTSR